MWLRTCSFAISGFSACSFNSFPGGQPSRLGFGKSSAKCFRPIVRNPFVEIGLRCRFTCFFIAHRFSPEILAYTL